MQTLRLRLRDLRAVSPEAALPADGVPIPALAAPDQEERPAFPNPSRPTFAVGLRSAVPAALIGTGPESGAVPRGRQGQRATRFRASLVGDALPDRVCRAALAWQTTDHAGDGPARLRQHGGPPVGLAACLPVCAVACLSGWPASHMPCCMSARLPVWQSACLCPSPDW